MVSLDHTCTVLIGREFLTLARAVVDMGEKTLRIGTGVDNLVVCRAGHLNPRNWQREVNVVVDIPACLRERRRDRILGLKACFVRFRPVLINARGGFTTCAQKSQGRVRKTLNSCPKKRGCSNDSSSSVEPVCVAADVNIVEEEEHTWQRVKEERNFSWTQSAGVHCCCPYSK